MTNRLPRMMVLASTIAGFSGLVGLFLSYYLSIASGAAIVLTCTLIFAVTWGIQALRHRQVSV
jgi:manganese/iron transport system permease protein